MDSNRRAYLEIHFAVFLWGFTAILGDLIQLSALVLVWWRVLITSVSLLFLLRSSRVFREMPRRLIFQYMGIGVLVAIHWLAFYGAIKLANASVALICMATTSFFTALLEPLLLRQRLKGYELFLGILVIPGMVLIANNLDFSMLDGFWAGLAAALLAALFSTLNKKLVTRAEPVPITFLELGSAWLFLCALLPFYLRSNPGTIFWPTWPDLGYLIILALLCTTLPYVLSLRALKHLSAFASNLTINMEPVYGIALAWIILKENKELSPGFYIGGAIILIAVFSYPVIRNKVEKLKS
ncbi:MAG: EamA family transporter [Saprospirales bacterium]|nr:EamA family transporter [Saprospirales bacterium]